MVKMEKVGSNFLDADRVKAVRKAVKACRIKFVGEPHKEKNDKYGNYSYHVDVEVLNPETEKTERKTWNMNGRTSDFLSEEWPDTADFVGKEIEVGVMKVSTKSGMVDSIYPVELMTDIEE